MSSPSASSIPSGSPESGLEPPSKAARLTEPSEQTDKDDGATEMSMSDIDAMLEASDDDEEDEESASAAAKKRKTIVPERGKTGGKKRQNADLKKGDVVWYLCVSSFLNKRHLRNRRVCEQDFDRKAEDFEPKDEVLHGKLYVVKTPRVSGKKPQVGLLPVFDLSDSTRRDLSKLQTEKKETGFVVRYKSNYDWNQRIIATIERSVRRYNDREDWQVYLQHVRRQMELVREFHGLKDRESVDPIDFLVRDNLDRRIHVPPVFGPAEERVQADVSRTNSSATNDSIIMLQDVESSPPPKEQSSTGSVVYARKSVSTEASATTSDAPSVSASAIVHEKAEMDDPEVTQRVALTECLLSCLEGGELDTHLTNIMSKKVGSRRHDYFVRVQSKRRIDFGVESEIGLLCNVNFVAENYDSRFGDAIKRVFNENASHLKGIRKAARNKAHFMSMYMEWCLQPEACIKFLMIQRGYEKYEDAERAYLKRCSEAEIQQFNAQMDHEIRENWHRKVLEEDDENIMLNETVVKDESFLDPELR